MNLKKLDFDKGDGLIPAIVQDAQTFQVLMLGYMNEDAVKQTLEEDRVTFFSRSKNRLWTKGETSGNYLDLVDIQADCDNDTILILARPHGPACHTGEASCFHEKDFSQENNLAFLNELEALIADRREKMPEGSYTSYLFSEGIDKMAQKVGEEAVETIVEAKNEKKTEKFVEEVADLLFHLMVLMNEKGITLKKLVSRLKERHKKGTHKHKDE